MCHVDTRVFLIGTNLISSLSSDSQSEFKLALPSPLLPLSAMTCGYRHRNTCASKTRGQLPKTSSSIQCSRLSETVRVCCSQSPRFSQNRIECIFSLSFAGSGSNLIGGVFSSLQSPLLQHNFTK